LSRPVNITVPLVTNTDKRARKALVGKTFGRVFSATAGAKPTKRDQDALLLLQEGDREKDLTAVSVPEEARYGHLGKITTIFLTLRRLSYVPTTISKRFVRP
jgi:hypothetical protein